MAETVALRPNLSTDLSVFILKIGHQNLSFSTDFVGLCHNSSLIYYFQEIVIILEINWPEYIHEFANF